MIITGFEKKGRKVLVHFENGKNMLLHYEIFLKNGLKLNTDITEDRFSFIQEENLKHDIKQTAFNLLSRRLHSTSELKTKLRQKYYNSPLIDDIIEHLTVNNYLDDQKFAVEFATEKSKVKLWGGRKISAELKRRGIDNKIIDTGILEGNEEDSSELIKAAAEKKLRSLQHRIIPRDKLKQKLITYLLSRGFEYDAIKKIVNTLMKDYLEEPD